MSQAPVFTAHSGIPVAGPRFLCAIPCRSLAPLHAQGVFRRA